LGWLAAGMTGGDGGLVEWSGGRRKNFFIFYYFL
jgi:hypothetical protein